MSRPVSVTTGTEITNPVTKPLYLVELGFPVTVRYSTGGTVTWNALLWQSASVRLSMPASGAWSLEIFNESYLIGQTALTHGTAGRTVRVYQLYGDGPYADDDAEALLDGQMGEASITPERVQIALKRRPPLRTPRIYFNPPVFNHLPPPGLVIRTAAGETVLEPKDNNQAWRRVKRR